jgi:hypothetical protein
VNGRVRLDLDNFSTPDGGQGVQVGKIIERHSGHPARLRKPALIDCAEHSDIVGSEQSPRHADDLLAIFRIQRTDVYLGEMVHRFSAKSSPLSGICEQQTDILCPILPELCRGEQDGSPQAARAEEREQWGQHLP